MSQLVNATQRTILFLIADTGAGHRSAANAISNALKIIAQREQEEWSARCAVVQEQAGQTQEQSPPTYRIEIVDVFAEYSRFPLREAVKLYGPTIRYNPRLYGEFFHRTNSEEFVLSATSLGSPLILNGLMRLLTSVEPDIIVSVHPVINFVTVKAIQELGVKVPFITVVTDLVNVHYAWFAPGVDGYVVPTEQAKQLYLQRGLAPERVHVLGMPIDPKFMQPVASKEQLYQKFELRSDLPVVLLVGGGDGAGGLRTAVQAISAARLPVQLIVVTGRNRRLYALLQSTRSKLHVPAKIFGFVNNMPELMHAADVIVTKAGPGTICEALACNLPIILSGFVPGQEEGNVEYIVKNKAGFLALDPESLIDTLRRLIKPGSPEMRQCVENARRISQPMAAFDIARYLLDCMKAGSARESWQSAHWQLRKRMLSGRLQSSFRLHRLQPRFPKPLLKSPIKDRPLLPGMRKSDRQSG